MKLYYIYGNIDDAENMNINMNKKLLIVKDGFSIFYALPFLNTVFLFLQKAFLAGIIMSMMSLILLFVVKMLGVNFNLFITYIMTLFFFGEYGNKLYQNTLIKKKYQLLLKIPANNKDKAMKYFFEYIDEIKKNKITFSL